MLSKVILDAFVIALCIMAHAFIPMSSLGLLVPIRYLMPATLVHVVS